MKILTLAAAAALAFTTTTAHAGGLADPIEPMKVMDTPSSSAKIIVPLLIVALVALAASQDD